MKPVLRVEGRAYDVVQMTFRGYDVSSAMIMTDERKCEIFYSEAEKNYIPTGAKSADFTKDLVWLSRYDELANNIDQRIEQNNEELHRIAIAHIENDKLPFADEGRLKHYKELQARTKGLLDVMDMIDELCMEEDVDLSGSEEPSVNFAGEVYVKE